MNIYIPIEIKSRELESKLLLAFEAASRGHEVLIGPLSIVFSWGPIGLLKPGIFHDKSLHPQVNLPGHKKIVANKSLVTSLDEESGLLDKSYDNFAKKRFSDESLNNVNLTFCWGDFDKQSLIKNYPKQKNKVVKTGSPRVDLWGSDFKIVYDKLFVNDYKLKGYILIVSNFGLVLNQNRFWDLQNHLMQNHYFDSDEYYFNQFDRYAFDVSLLKAFVQMVRRLSAEFPDEQIVVRPHPVENTSGWQILLGNLPNVGVKRSGSINAWVNNAKIIIHNGCTTAFEARVNNKNVIAYRPIKSSFEREIPNLISYQIFNLAELIETVKRCLGDINHKLPYDEVADKVLNHRLGLPRKDYAFKQIVTAWEALETPELSQPNDWTYLLMRLKFSAIKKKAVGRFRLDRGQKKERQLDVSHKFPTLEMKEIKAYQEAYSLLFPNFSTVKIKKIFDKTFLFKLK